MLSQKEIKHYKMNAKRIEVSAGDDIGEILKNLEKLHNEGKYNYYVEINGKRAYSADIDYQKDFKIIVGISEDELKDRIERANLKEKLKQKEIEADAIALLDYRKIAGKKLIEPAKHELWEELVEKYSKPPYFTDAIDSMIKYFELLNSDFTLEEIIEKLNEQYGSLGDWYTSAFLSNLAKFNRRGIRLFELIREIAKENGDEVSNDNGYFDHIRRVNEFIDLGEEYIKAEELANIKTGTIKICNIEHHVLINDNRIAGIMPDYFVMGEIIGEDIALYMIEGTKVNSYLSVNGETIEKYVDGSIGKTISSAIKIEYNEQEPLQIRNAYDKILATYNQLDVLTNMEVICELNELQEEISINDAQTVPAIKIVFQKRKEKIPVLRKSTK